MLEVRCSGGKTFYQRYTDARGRERQFKIGPADVLRAVGGAAKGAHRAGAGAGRRRSAGAAGGAAADPDARRAGARPLSAARQELQAELADRRDRAARPHPSGVRDRISSIGSGASRSPRWSSGCATRAMPPAPPTASSSCCATSSIWRASGACRASRKIRPPGLDLAPDVNRERFLSVEEAQRLIASIEQDENEVAAQGDHAAAAHRRAAQRDHPRQMGARRLGQADAAGAAVEVGQAARHRAQRAALALLRSIVPIDGCPYVFPSPATGRPSPSLYFPWQRIRMRAGLPDLRLHDLRHSFASFLVNSGVSLYVVQGLLGHAHARYTQRYAHLTRRHAAGSGRDRERRARGPVAAGALRASVRDSARRGGAAVDAKGTPAGMARRGQSMRNRARKSADFKSLDVSRRA